jgi:hypothetical protein
MDHTSVCTTAQLAIAYMHLRCTHSAWISFTSVHLYCSPVFAHMYCKFVATNKSPSVITFMNCVDQSQLRVLGIPTISPELELNYSMLTTSFPRDVVKSCRGYMDNTRTALYCHAVIFHFRIHLFRHTVY